MNYLYSYIALVFIFHYQIFLSISRIQDYDLHISDDQLISSICFNNLIQIKY